MEAIISSNCANTHISERSKPSVIFMGSKPGSVVALQALLNRGWNVNCVVISKTIPHPWYDGPTLEVYAKEIGIPVYAQSEIVENVNAVDYVISYMYRHLVKPCILNLATHAAVNFHAAPLPDYGGWGTYNLAILNEENSFGCTCHHMGKGFDNGPLVKVRRFKIDHSVLTGFDLERLAQEEMLRLFVEFIFMIEMNFTLPSIPQDINRSKYLSMTDMQNLKKIPDGSSDEVIEKYARAFWFPPYSGAFLKLGEKEVEVTPQCIKERIAILLNKGVFSRLAGVLADSLDQVQL